MKVDMKVSYLVGMMDVYMVELMVELKVAI
jgi:hypothetical protein